MGALYVLDHRLDQVPTIGGSGKRNNLWQKLRQRGSRKSSSKTSTSTKAHENSWEYNRILAADFQLIDLEVDANELRSAPSHLYDGIYGIFCKLDFAVHKEDPSSGKFTTSEYRFGCYS